MSETRLEEHSGAAPMEPTGVEPVDAALASLQGLGEKPLHEHPEAFETAHAALRAVLTDEPRA
jgi:hypothetical protein